MKVGDIVRYKTSGPIHHRIGDYPGQDELWIEKGLLIGFDKIQRMCEILDNKTGEIIRKHCGDVQLVKVGHASR
jgi:hypothetical protein